MGWRFLTGEIPLYALASSDTICTLQNGPGALQKAMGDRGEGGAVFVRSVSRIGHFWRRPTKILREVDCWVARQNAPGALQKAAAERGEGGTLRVRRCLQLVQVAP